MDRFIELFKALGQDTRLGILKVLAMHEMCVCELEEILEMSQPRISQNLKILKQAGLVEERKEGSWRFYKINWEALEGAFADFGQFLKIDLAESKGFAREAKNYKQVTSGPRSERCSN